MNSDWCNNKNATQPNQLWVLPSNPIDDGASRHNVTPWQGAVTTTGSSRIDDDNVLVSVASLVENGYRVEASAVLGAPQNNGAASGAALINGLAPPAGPDLASWDLIPVPAPNPDAPTWDRVKNMTLNWVETNNSGAGLDSNWKMVDSRDFRGNNEYVIPDPGVRVTADNVPLPNNPLEKQMEQGRYWVEYPAGTVAVRRAIGGSVVQVPAVNLLQAGDVDKVGYSDTRVRCLDVLGSPKIGAELTTYDCDPGSLSQRWVKVRVGALANNYALVNVAGLLQDGTGTRLLDNGPRVSFANPGNGGCCAIIGSTATLQGPHTGIFSQFFAVLPTIETPAKLQIIR